MATDVMWKVVSEPGLEHLRLVEGETDAVADGLILGVDESAPFRLAYRVRAAGDWTTRECWLQVGGAGGPELRLLADGQGHWADAAGESLPALDGCLDVDIRVTPFTNTLPIRRLGLEPGVSGELAVVYIAAPALSARAVSQRYTCLARGDSGAVYRYEGLETGFRAELTVDEQGLVLEYAGVWKRVWAKES